MSAARRFLCCIGAALALAGFSACDEPDMSLVDDNDTLSAGVSGMEPAPQAQAIPAKIPEISEELLRQSIWHASEGLGSTFADRYVFEGGGRFIYSNNNRMERLFYSVGDWRIEGGELLLSADRVMVLEGGTPAEDEQSGPYIAGGKLITSSIPEDARIVERYPLKIGTWGNPDHFNSIWIGDSEVWASSLDISDMTDFRDGNEVALP